MPCPSLRTAALLSPMLWLQRCVTFTLGCGSGVSFAGWSTFLSFEQATINRSAARAPWRARARVGVSPRCSGMVLLAGGRGAGRGGRSGGGGRRRLRRATLEVGDLQLQERGITGFGSGSLRTAVFAQCRRLVALGVKGIAADFVEAGAECAGIGHGAESGERAVGLTLGNLHPGEPLACDPRELLVPGVLDDRGELAGGVIELGLVDVHARREQPGLVRVGRARVIALELTEQHQRLRTITALERANHLHVPGGGLEPPRVLVALPPAPAEDGTRPERDRQQHGRRVLAYLLLDPLPLLFLRQIVFHASSPVQPAATARAAMSAASSPPGNCATGHSL